MNTYGWIWGVGVVALGLTACAAAEMPTRMDGARLFAENCAVCHGETGQGDGPLAGDLGRRPADLTRLAEWDGGFDRARILSVIDGYTRVREGVHRMPEFGALLTGETVPVDLGDGAPSPVPRPLAALLFYLESIQPG